MKQSHWPERWDYRKGAIYYRPRKDEQAKEPFASGGKYYYRLGATESEAFEAWAKLYTKIFPRSIAIGIARYKASKRWLRLADKTRKDYAKSLVRINAVFGQMHPSDVLPKDIYDYLDARPITAGKRDIAAFSNVLFECVKAGAIKHNPCLDIRYEPEEPRDRYVEDWEIEEFAETCDLELQARIAVLWATGSRPGQIRQLTVFAWDGEGLKVPGAKKGKTNRITGPVLEKTIPAMLAARTGKRAKSEYLFPNRSGKMYTDDGWRTGFQRAMKLWGEAGNERFQERDIRAKVVSDEESFNEAQKRAAHTSASTTNRVYRRKTVNVTELGSTALSEYATRLANRD